MLSRYIINNDNLLGYDSSNNIELMNSNILLTQQHARGYTDQRHSVWSSKPTRICSAFMHSFWHGTSTANTNFYQLDQPVQTRSQQNIASVVLWNPHPPIRSLRPVLMVSVARVFLATELYITHRYHWEGTALPKEHHSSPRSLSEVFEY